MSLNDYVTLGYSGLRVSPLCLGTMTFGEEWGWGATVAESEAILSRFLEGGAGRKSLVAACEQSLRRLQTDYIDLYWMHLWDKFTPIEETMSALDDLVRAGKVRYVGFSDTPAWKTAQAQSVAEFRGWTPLVALQIEYS